MNKENNIDYTIHYKNSHNDENLENDIKKSLWIIETQKIQPRDKNSKVLDIGCGQGIFLLALKRLGYTNLYGCDIDEGQVKIALNKKIDNIECSDGIAYLKKTEEVFDNIYLSDVLEHLTNEEQLGLLKLIYKHLAPDGFCYIQVPNACSMAANYFRYADWTHETLFTEESLAFVLKNAGFTEINIREFFKPSKKLFLEREKFLKALQLETSPELNPILSYNLSAVVYKSKNENNIFMDRFWGTNATKEEIKMKKHKTPKLLVNLLCFFIPKKKK